MLQQIFHMHFVPWLSLFHFLAISLIPSLSSPPMLAGRGVVTTLVSSPNSLITLCFSASSFTCSSTKAQVGSKLATQKGQGSQPHAAFLWASHPNLFYRAKFRPLEFSSSKLFSSVFFSYDDMKRSLARGNGLVDIGPGNQELSDFLGDIFSQASCRSVRHLLFGRLMKSDRSFPSPKISSKSSMCSFVSDSIELKDCTAQCNIG